VTRDPTRAARSVTRIPTPNQRQQSGVAIKAKARAGHGVFRPLVVAWLRVFRARAGAAIWIRTAGQRLWIQHAHAPRWRPSRPWASHGAALRQLRAPPKKRSRVYACVRSRLTRAFSRWLGCAVRFITALASYPSW